MFKIKAHSRPLLYKSNNRKRKCWQNNRATRIASKKLIALYSSVPLFISRCPNDRNELLSLVQVHL